MINQILPLALPMLLAGALVAQAGKADNPDRLYQLHELKTTVLPVNGHKLKLWLMDTPSKRGEGMMFLKSADVKIEEGMLFVFAYPQHLSFWMKNTFIPLDIAYIDKEGKILNVEQMKPHNETGVPSKGEALYALEMKRGAFKKYGIKAGMKLAIPAGVKAKT